MKNIQKVCLPKWGTTMQEAYISHISVTPGESISKGQALLGIETDKVVTDIQSPAQGVVCDILVKQGDVVPVGAVLLTVEVS